MKKLLILLPIVLFGLTSCGTEETKVELDKLSETAQEAKEVSTDNQESAISKKTKLDIKNAVTIDDIQEGAGLKDDNPVLLYIKEKGYKFVYDENALRNKYKFTMEQFNELEDGKKVLNLLLSNYLNELGMKEISFMKDGKHIRLELEDDLLTVKYVVLYELIEKEEDMMNLNPMEFSEPEEKIIKKVKYGKTFIDFIG